MIHHRDRGSQYLPIRYTERLAEAGVESSVGSTGDPTTTPWLKRSTGYTKEIIHKRGPWRTVDDVEYATLE